MAHVLEMPMLDDNLASASKWKVLDMRISQLFMEFEGCVWKVFELFGCNFKIVGEYT